MRYANETWCSDPYLLTPYTSTSLTTPGWSGNGNLTSVQYPAVGGVSTGSWTYTYDSQNRMLGASGPGNSVTFAYDARNRCVKRVINGTTRYQIFDGWNLLAEHGTGGGSGTPIVRYVHGATVDEIITGTVVSSGTKIYSHHDALGSVIALSDASGSIVEKVTYDAYGYPTILTPGGAPLSTSAYGNRFLFTGRELVREAALYDYRNRMYSPQLGRFMQTDPIGFEAGDSNLYRYVGNHVLNYVDRDGLKKCGSVSVQPLHSNNKFSNFCANIASIFGINHSLIKSHDGQILDHGGDAILNNGWLSSRIDIEIPEDMCCEKFKECMNKSFQNAGDYNVASNNCTDAIEKAVRTCGGKLETW